MYVYTGIEHIVDQLTGIVYIYISTPYIDDQNDNLI